VPLVWAKTVTFAEVVKQVNAVEARLATLEADFAALKAQLVKGDELRTRLGALEEFANINREALRAIFTVFYPGPIKDVATQRAATEQLLTDWLDEFGGRLPLPGSAGGDS
jgi:hypothetical protein